MARLELMQRALMQGAAPAEAARYARTAVLPPRDAAGSADAGLADAGSIDGGLADAGSIDGGLADAGSADAGSADTLLTNGAAAVAQAGPPLQATTGEEGPPERRARGGGGATLRMPGAGARARGLGRAALAMDSTAVQHLVEESISAEGLIATWEEVARPVLAAVGERWAVTGRGVEVEHLLSQCLATVFATRAVAASAARPEVSHPVRPVLLAAMPSELHVVPLAVLAALLAERGIGHRSLGADLPAEALATAVRRTAPAAVVLWSQLSSTADLAVVTGLPVTRPRYRTFVAGPGWNGAALPPGIGVLGSLVDAGERIAGAVLR